jgi:hypothetical protein
VFFVAGGHEALDFVAGVEAAGIGAVVWGGGSAAEDCDDVVEEFEDFWGC